MADAKTAYGAVNSFTLTSLNSLASSATAGWMSAAVDNSSDKYLDALVHIELASVNTAPGSSKAIFLFAYGLVDDTGTAYTSTGAATTTGTPSGSVGTITFPDVSSLAINAPLLGVVPYSVQNSVLNGGPFSVAACFGGRLPIEWGVLVLNHAGFTIAASGNALKWRGVYNTVT